MSNRVVSAIQEPTVMDVKLEHPVKAPTTILVVLSGIVMDVIFSVPRPVFNNMSDRVVFAIQEPTVMDVKLEHPVKELALIVVALSGIVTDVICDGLRPVFNNMSNRLIFSIQEPTVMDVKLEYPVKELALILVTLSRIVTDVICDGLRPVFNMSDRVLSPIQEPTVMDFKLVQSLKALLGMATILFPSTIDSNFKQYSKALVPI